MTTADENQFHGVQFYKDDASLAITVADFLARGFRTRHPGLIIATPAHTKRILQQLTADGFDTNDLRRTGSLQTLDADQTLATFMIGALPDALLFKSNVGNAIERLCEGRKPCPIRAYGEMVDRLWQSGNEDGAIRLEIMWNRLASAYDFSLLCGYSHGQFFKETRDERYRVVCDQHTHVLPSETLEA